MNKNQNNMRDLMSDSKFYMGYSRWIDELDRYETWNEAVSRVMDMHREKYASVMSPSLGKWITGIQDAYSNKLVLGAQRALQFGGSQIFKHEAKLYNCSSSYVDRPTFFQECMYLLLCGCGVGFSVQKQHVAKLPPIARRSKKKAKVFEVEDSIEGWADAFGVLLASYFLEGAPDNFEKYRGCQVRFDFTKIRPRGSKISGGFRAPGPEGLRNALVKCEDLLEDLLEESPIANMRPITAYDFVMHMSDAVLSGGVRRSATICLFSKDDEEMLNAKVGDWSKTNPQRGRSNNSVVLVKDKVTREEWNTIFESIKSFGEPGFFFTCNEDQTTNPCCEIGMVPRVMINGKWESGFQFCNLTEINGGKCSDKEIFFEACKYAAALGTIQAGYTNFHYLSDATRLITEREALLGVSITGWMNNPDVLFDEATMRQGAEIVKRTNKEVAKLIGINQAARTTCTKPSGTSSIFLQTSYGIHTEYARRYFRNVQINRDDDIARIISETNPWMVQESVWSVNKTDVVVSYPIENDEKTIVNKNLTSVQFLDYIKKAQTVWVENGTNVELCVDPTTRHNISNTVTVDNWDEVSDYIFENRHYFSGISLLPATGDKLYNQAPLTEVFTAKEILKMYGVGGVFASGLIVDGLACFGDNLWLACDAITAKDKEPDEAVQDSTYFTRKNWVRRAKKFAKNYFNGNEEKMIFCLKDCYNLHRWESIQRKYHPIAFVDELKKPTFIDADTLASQACAGGACVIEF